MNINVLNASFKRIAVFDSYTSLIWAKRYYDIGALDLQVEANAENLNLFKRGNYITRDDDDNIYRIEALELSTEINNDNSLIVGAYDCKKLLSQRIIWNQINFSGTVENFIRRIVAENVINPANTDRQIDNFRLSTPAGFTETIIAQAQYDEVAEKVTELCRANGYGWRVSYSDNIFTFELYKGVDRSADQSENPRIVFSPSYDNLMSSKYNVDGSEFKNVALVGGEGEGTERKTRSVGDGRGLNRYELYVDSNASSNDGGDLVDYYAALEADGKSELAEHETTTTFEGEIDTTTYVYKTDYNLGDIVTIENEYGIKVNARIVEIAETWNSEGYSIDPVFEYIDDDLDGAILTENEELLMTENEEGIIIE